MARRTRSLGFRLVLVLAIPTLYCLFASLAGLARTAPGAHAGDFSAGFSDASNFVGSSRKLLQVPTVKDNETLLLELSENCTPPSIKEFPNDGLTRNQRQHGYIIIHVIVAIYCFLLLAIVCDDFFVPSITKICESGHVILYMIYQMVTHTYLSIIVRYIIYQGNMPIIAIFSEIGVTKDVAGATFMAAASSSPELFINIVGTFVTEGDLGVGTIVGSAVFNILAVPACCGLFATQILDLDWWPVSRDSLAYGVTVLLLIFTLHDSRIEWWEAFILVLFYILYILAMCFNTRISSCMNLFVSKRRRKYKNLSEESPLIVRDSKFHDSFVNSKSIKNDDNFFTNTKVKDALYHNGDCNGVMDVESLELSQESMDIVNMTNWPENGLERCWWVFTYPINAVLLVTIPDCRRLSLRNWYPITFIMCIVWIAVVSYIVGWVITIIGDTLRIPDSVMGLTFLAAGMSVPEAVSSVIVTNQGHGTMGISNSIGSNVFDVLLCLGLPWFVKAMFFPTVEGQHFVQINSEGLIYSSVSLMSTLILLYVVLSCNRFKLDKRVGLVCLMMYGVFLVFASLIELNVFFVVNRPTCDI